jgi:hypothetical protein
MYKIGVDLQRFTCLVRTDEYCVLTLGRTQK